ncbi:T-cell receptor alpha chain V region 2B4 [Tupaia chinensis]|nr:T-cell receptor alpha chain V region 2B4 [Tupaia chinensis]
MENHLAASLLILWIHFGRVSSVPNVAQSPRSLHVQEGESTNFTCSFPSSSFYSLHWYRQEPAKSPKILFVISANGDEKQEGRVKVTLNTKEGYSFLYIKESQPEDSASYLCALTQCFSGTCSPYPKPWLVLLCSQRQQRAICAEERANSVNYRVSVIEGLCRRT